MRLTTKGRYAVTAVLDLAFHEDKGPISLAAISARQCLSLSYLEQLFAKLRRDGIVKSTRGPGGGYRLNRGVEDISISEIIIAVDEDGQTAPCEDQGCTPDYQCLTHDLWQELSEEIRDFLGNISLAEVMENDAVKKVNARQDQTTVNAA